VKALGRHTGAFSLRWWRRDQPVRPVALSPALFYDLDSIAIGIEEGALVISISSFTRPIKDSKTTFAKPPSHAIDGFSRTK
jgi:hypothetical protein